MFGLEPKLTVAITGGAGGIGSAICELFFEYGHTPVSINSEAPNNSSIPYINSDLSMPNATASSSMISN